MRCRYFLSLGYRAPERESIKPDGEDEDGSEDIDTEDLDFDKTEGDESVERRQGAWRLGIFLAPAQRLPDHFVLIRAGEMMQKSLATFVINERSERTAFRTPPGVQLDHMMPVINASLKRWRIPQICSDRYTLRGECNSEDLFFSL